MTAVRKPSSPDYFNSRSPCGERHEFSPDMGLMIVISTHAPRVGSDRNQNQAHRHRQISTHAPRVGSDLPAPHVPHTTVHISTHAPRVGSDVQVPVIGFARSYFNSRSPCGERPMLSASKYQECYFNSRSPCGERLSLCSFLFCGGYFNSRSPCGERQQIIDKANQILISTHAPRVGSDRQPPAV